VLRILTKICEWFLYKFLTDNYYSNRSGNIKLQRGGHTNILFPFMRKKLDQYILEEKEDILKHMKELAENNY
jgi:hypothetical protein